MLSEMEILVHYLLFRYRIVSEICQQYPCGTLIYEAKHVNDSKRDEMCRFTMWGKPSWKSSRRGLRISAWHSPSVAKSALMWVWRYSAIGLSYFTQHFSFFSFIHVLEHPHVVQTTQVLIKRLLKWTLMWPQVFPRGWDKTFCLQFVENEFSEIHFFGDKTYPVHTNLSIF